MRVFGFREALKATDPQAIIEERQDRPTATGHDILVEVKAVSVNPVDTKVRAGKAKDGSLKVGGWDAAGIVVAVGDQVGLFKVGDAVWYAGDISRAGSHADYQLVDEYIAAKKPESLSFEEAAAMPLTLLTAWEALHTQLGISHDPIQNAGKKLLVVNGAGGVGSLALQLARRAGVHVTATASRAESRAWCLDQGATDVIGHDALATLPDNSFDWILCAHTTDKYFDTLVRLVKPHGAVCLITSAMQKHDIQPLMHKSARLVWEFMFTHSSYRTPDRIKQHQVLMAAARLVDTGVLKTTLTRALAPLSADSLRQAHEILEQGGMIGKLALPVGA